MLPHASLVCALDYGGHAVRNLAVGIAVEHERADHGVVPSGQFLRPVLLPDVPKRFCDSFHESARGVLNEDSVPAVATGPSLFGAQDVRRLKGRRGMAKGGRHEADNAASG